MVTVRVRQLSLPFDDTPLWDPASLENAIGRESARPLALTLTDNRSVLLSFRRAKGVVQLRLHRMFLHAPLLVVRALARGLRRTNRRADGEVRRFMNDNLHRVRRVPRALPTIVTAGRYHDILAVFERLNERFFSGKMKVPITWGRGSGRARRGGLTFGSYDPVLSLIRIHPVLDRREVPLYFLESVVYHEMLHHQMGGCPTRPGARSTTRGPSARRRPATPGTARRSIGRRTISPSCCARARPSIGNAAPFGPWPRRETDRGSVALHLRRLLPNLKRKGAASPSASSPCS